MILLSMGNIFSKEHTRCNKNQTEDNSSSSGDGNFDKAFYKRRTPRINVSNYHDRGTCLLPAAYLGLPFFLRATLRSCHSYNRSGEI